MGGETGRDYFGLFLVPRMGGLCPLRSDACFDKHQVTWGHGGSMFRSGLVVFVAVTSLVTGRVGGLRLPFHETAELLRSS